MQIGDVVRLKQPFRPEPDGTREYQFGIVAGLVRSEEQPSFSPPNQVVLYLYDLQTAAVYVDKSGMQALFGFRRNEVEPLS